MRRRRVLWVIKGLGPGGAEQLLLTHARFGDQNAFEYSAAYFVPWKSHLVDDLSESGVKATLLGTGRNADPRWVVRLWIHLWRGRFDIVHSHSPLPSAAVRVVNRLVPKSRRPRLIATEHNEWGKHRRGTRWLNRITMRGAGTVVAVSDAVRRSMDTNGDVEVVHHGIDADAVRATADRSAVRDELKLPDDALVVGTVANLRREKGYDLLLQAARRVFVESDCGRKVWFVAVGQGPMEDELNAQHRRLGLGDRFRFLGYRPDATRVMSGFDLFCLASRHEGLPVAVMEAAALGLPIVATDVGGLAEVLDPLELPRAGDLDSLVGAIERALVRLTDPSPPTTEFPDGFDGRRFVARLEELYQS